MGTTLPYGTYVPNQKESYLDKLDDTLRRVDAAMGEAILFDDPRFGGSPLNTGAENDAAAAALAAYIGSADSLAIRFGGRQGFYDFDSPLPFLTNDRIALLGSARHNAGASGQAAPSTLRYTGADTAAFLNPTGDDFLLAGLGIDGLGSCDDVLLSDGDEAWIHDFSLSGLKPHGFGCRVMGPRSNVGDYAIFGNNAADTIGLAMYANDWVCGGEGRVVGCTRFGIDGQAGNGALGGAIHITSGSQQSGTLHSLANAGDGTLDVDETAAPPPLPFNAYLPVGGNYEIVIVTTRVNVSGSRWTYGGLTRGAPGGVAAASHAAGQGVFTRAVGNVRFGSNYGTIGGAIHFDTAGGGPILTIGKDASSGGGALNDVTVIGVEMYDVNVTQILDEVILFDASVFDIHTVKILGCTYTGTQAAPTKYFIGRVGSVDNVMVLANQLFACTDFWDPAHPPETHDYNTITLSRGGTIKTDKVPIANPPTFTEDGVLSVGVGTKPWYNDTGRTIYLQYVRLYAGTSPTGAALIVDLLLDGTTTMFTGTKPTVAAAGHTSKTPPDAGSTIAIPDGHFIVPSITQVGSTIPGSDLTMQVGIAG